VKKTLHKQTDRQTDKQTNRHYENNGHLAVNQKFYKIRPTTTTTTTVRRRWRENNRCSRDASDRTATIVGAWTPIY